MIAPPVDLGEISYRGVVGLLKGFVLAGCLGDAEVCSMSGAEKTPTRAKSAIEVSSTTMTIAIDLTRGWAGISAARNLSQSTNDECKTASDQQSLEWVLLRKPYC